MRLRYTFKSLLILILLVNTAHGQAPSLEEQWASCVYSGYQDRGKALRLALDDFEQLLIEQGVLSGRSGASYKAMLKEMAAGNVGGTKSRSAMIQKIIDVESQGDSDLINECHATLVDHPDFEAVLGNTKKAFEDLIIKDNFNLQAYSSTLLKTYSKPLDTFYIKLLILIGFDLDLVFDGE
jgi:hypothetical protein